MMTDRPETRNLPWQVVQRNLAQAGVETGNFAIGRRQIQPHWRFTPATDCWLNRMRRGVGGGSPRR